MTTRGPIESRRKLPKEKCGSRGPLFSASYDDFEQAWVNDVNTEDEVAVAARCLSQYKICIEAHRMGLVCWYDVADRPFPGG